MTDYHYTICKKKCFGDGPSNTLLECKKWSSMTVSSRIIPFQTVSSITLNIKNICKPCILLRFSIVLTHNGIISTTINFRVSKIIYRTIQALSGIYAFTTSAGSPSVTHFNFNFWLL